MSSPVYNNILNVVAEVESKIAKAIVAEAEASVARSSKLEIYKYFKFVNSILCESEVSVKIAAKSYRSAKDRAEKYTHISTYHNKKANIAIEYLEKILSEGAETSNILEELAEVARSIANFTLVNTYKAEQEQQYEHGYDPAAARDKVKVKIAAAVKAEAEAEAAASAAVKVKVKIAAEAEVKKI